MIMLQAWDSCEEFFIYHEGGLEQLIEAQHLEQKTKNYDFACLKGLYISDKRISIENKKAYKKSNVI